MLAVNDKISARVALVEEHLFLENNHKIEELVQTFGEDGALEDRALGMDFVRHPNIKAYYDDLMRGVPDLHVEIRARYIAEDAIVAEGRATGTHLGEWRGLPATGRTLDIPLCGVFTFDGAERLAAERVYYDRALVLRQLGVFHDPDTPSGKVITMLTHPLTMAGIIRRQVLRR